MAGNCDVTITQAHGKVRTNSASLPSTSMLNTPCSHSYFLIKQICYPLVVYAYTPAPFPAIFSPARGRDVTSGDDVIDDVTIRLLGNDDIYNVVAR